MRHPGQVSALTAMLANPWWSWGIAQPKIASLKAKLLARLGAVQPVTEDCINRDVCRLTPCIWSTLDGQVKMWKILLLL